MTMTRDEWIEYLDNGEECDADVISVVSKMHTLRSENGRLKKKIIEIYDIASQSSVEKYAFDLGRIESIAFSEILTEALKGSEG